MNELSSDIEQLALETYEDLSANWRQRYYEGEVGNDMDVYDLRTRHQLAVALARGLGPVSSALEVG